MGKPLHGVFLKDFPPVLRSTMSRGETIDGSIPVKHAGLIFQNAGKAEKALYFMILSSCFDGNRTMHDKENHISCTLTFGRAQNVFGI